MRAVTYPLPGARAGTGWPDAPAWPLFAGLGPLGALPTAPRLVRAFCGLVLSGWGVRGLLADCEMVTTELATNVVDGATGPDGEPLYDARTGRLPVLWIRLMSDGERLRAEIWDDLAAERGVPTHRPATPSDESGRGLQLVEALTLDWGWEQLPNDAKRVWALLGPGGKE